ncbi:MAG: HK97 gp10 family phage protein [Gammaproteobacteria bacterium]|nr:HK97 gp10 family phage protein [Gammaproteobacteria bacterium]MYC99175.1 HK97 gp10 family phage protein [Gammaproteobacteria bacterium]
MIEVKVDTSELDALIARLEGEELVEVLAETVLEEAKRTVPVDTGALKRSGRVEARPNNARAVVFGDRRANYAGPVHFTPGGRGFDWLRRAAMNAHGVQAAVAKRARQLIGR